MRSLFATVAVVALGLAACKDASVSPGPAGGAKATGKARLAVCNRQSACRHVYDMAGVLPAEDVPRFEDYMGGILRESDVDVRFAFVSGTGERSIEQLAVDMVSEMRIGGKTREERGVLLLYDMRGHRLKVEVGYGLEAYFPDAFVSYLVQDHARMFFESGNITLGLRLLLRLLQHRIREAVIGADFDPRVVQAVRAGGYLSGGAGVTAAVPSAGASGAPAANRMSDEDRSRFRAQKSPADSHQAYLAWLAHPLFDPDVDLFTEGSRKYLSRLPLSPAYRHFILFGEYGKRYRAVERDDLALLYFTGTPFTSPHFFVNEGGVWRMDIQAEVSNTRERVGGIYTWDYRGQGDRYTQAFADLLTDLKGYRRIKEGDNRALVIRGSKGL
jgi:hypothetical protein